MAPDKESIGWLVLPSVPEWVADWLGSDAGILGMASWSASYQSLKIANKKSSITPTGIEF